MASTTTGTHSPEELSEEELRAYFAQLREAPVADMLGQAYAMLGSWAEAKLGRPDARPLIDALNALVQGAGAGLPDDLARRMRDGIAQLQMAQVQAEQQLANERKAQAIDQQAAPNPASRSPGDPPKTQQPPSSGADEGAQRLTDRLWIPGRDPRPPPRS
ncbi:MAG: hypothetical protein ACRDZ4_07320 [Egibacteraceae bacterium]